MERTAGEEDAGVGARRLRAWLLARRMGQAADRGPHVRVYGGGLGFFVFGRRCGVVDGRGRRGGEGQHNDRDIEEAHHTCCLFRR